MDIWVISTFGGMLLWTLVYAYLFQHLFSIILSNIPLSGIAGSYCNSVSNYLRNRSTVLHSSIPFYIPASNKQEFNSSTSMCTHCFLFFFFLCLFNINNSNGYEVVFHCGPNFFWIHSLPQENKAIFFVPKNGENAFSSTLDLKAALSQTLIWLNSVFYPCSSCVLCPFPNASPDKPSSQPKHSFILRRAWDLLGAFVV